VTGVLAAYGVGSPLLWWLVTAAGVVLMIVSVFLLREPAGADRAPATKADGAADADAQEGPGSTRAAAAKAPAGGSEDPAAAPTSPPS